MNFLFSFLKRKRKFFKNNSMKFSWFLFIFFELFYQQFVLLVKHYFTSKLINKFIYWNREKKNNEIELRSIEKQFNSSISQIYFILSIFNVGLFRSSSSFINNSLSMYSILFGYSFWFSNSLSVISIEIKSIWWSIDF